MTDSHATFIKGAAVFRNASQLAELYRDQLIQAAYRKAV